MSRTIALSIMAGQVSLGSGLWIVLLGWPAIFVSLIAFLLAVVRKSRPAAVVGCLFAAPMFLYLSLSPRYFLLAPLAFLLLCVLTWRIRQAGWLAVVAMALPATSILVWLGIQVLNE